MRIKLVVATADRLYRDRLGSLLQERYRGRITLSLFSDIEMALLKANEMKADIILTDEYTEIMEADMPKRCKQVYLVDEKGIRSIGGKPAVCKYQHINDFYGDLMEVFSNQSDETDVEIDGESRKKTIVSFTSTSGGVGVSTLAAAYALHLAQSGISTLYLNLEDFGSSELYFTAEGKQSFSNVIYALELGNTSTFLRIESALRKSQEGVYFISPAETALDMKDLTEELIGILFENLGKSKLIETIVVDLPFRFDDRSVSQMKRSDTVVFVSDGSLTSNYKLKKVSDAIEIMSRTDEKLTDCAMYLLYNRFSSRNGKKAENTIFREAGGLGRIENAEPVDLVNHISTNRIFDSF